jgi:hypothetical protein
LVSNTGGDTTNTVVTNGSGKFAGLNNANLVYDLGNNLVEVPCQYSTGNGTSDYIILIKKADFKSAASGYNTNPCVDVFADMGGYQGFVASGGLEEVGLGPAIGTCWFQYCLTLPS